MNTNIQIDKCIKLFQKNIHLFKNNLNIQYFLYTLKFIDVLLDLHGPWSSTVFEEKETETQK